MSRSSGPYGRRKGDPLQRHLAVADHQQHVLQRPHVLQRIARQQDQVGLVAGRDAAGAFAQPQQFGRADRRRLQRFEGAEAETHEVPDLQRNAVDRLVVVVVVGAGGELHAEAVRVADGLLQPRHHVRAAQAQHVVVLLLVHLDHGDQGRHEPGAFLLHQAQGVLGQVGAVFDAAGAGLDRGAGALVAVRVHHNRESVLRGLVDDDFQLCAACRPARAGRCPGGRRARCRGS
jgi:hypothetical protein